MKKNNGKKQRPKKIPKKDKTPRAREPFAWVKDVERRKQDQRRRMAVQPMANDPASLAALLAVTGMAASGIASNDPWDESFRSMRERLGDVTPTGRIANREPEMQNIKPYPKSFREEAEEFFDRILGEAEEHLSNGRLVEDIMKVPKITVIDEGHHFATHAKSYREIEEEVDSMLGRFVGVPIEHAGRDVGLESDNKNEEEDDEDCS